MLQKDGQTGGQSAFLLPAFDTNNSVGVRDP